MGGYCRGANSYIVRASASRFARAHNRSAAPIRSQRKNTGTASCTGVAMRTFHRLPAISVYLVFARRAIAKNGARPGSAIRSIWPRLVRRIALTSEPHVATTPAPTAEEATVKPIHQDQILHQGLPCLPQCQSCG